MLEVHTFLWLRAHVEHDGEPFKVPPELHICSVTEQFTEEGGLLTPPLLRHFHVHNMLLNELTWRFLWPLPVNILQVVVPDDLSRILAIKCFATEVSLGLIIDLAQEATLHFEVVIVAVKDEDGSRDAVGVGDINQLEVS